jgi:hypothetical protein
MKKSIVLRAGVVALAGIAISLTIQHQAQVELSGKDEALRRQNDQLAELAAEHQHLSNLVAQATNLRVDERLTELQRLRGEAEALRKQANVLASQQENSLRSRTPYTTVHEDGLTAEDVLDHPPEWLEEYWAQLNQRTGPKWNDATSLLWGLSEYARDHQGQFPSSLDQIGSYLSKAPFSLTGTNEFEIVCQGSISELTNTPQGAVALIRERQAWLAPNGRWARVYGMAGDGPKTIVTDDNFQSWEAEHILPPPSAGQQ